MSCRKVYAQKSEIKAIGLIGNIMSFAIGLIRYVMKSDDTGSMPGLYIVKIHLLKPIDLHGWIAIMLCY